MKTLILVLFVLVLVACAASKKHGPKGHGHEKHDHGPAHHGHDHEAGHHGHDHEAGHHGHDHETGHHGHDHGPGEHGSTAPVGCSKCPTVVTTWKRMWRNLLKVCFVKCKLSQTCVGGDKRKISQKCRGNCVTREYFQCCVSVYTLRKRLKRFEWAF